MNKDKIIRDLRVQIAERDKEIADRVQDLSNLRQVNIELRMEVERLKGEKI